MKFNIVAIIVLIIVSEITLTEQILLIPANCTEIYSETVPQYIPYEELYSTKNWLGQTKYKTRINYKLQNHVIYKKRSVCCAGYSTIRANNMCSPICSRDCGLNAVCSGPEHCKCDAGYLMDPLLNTCKPICLNECINGDCTSPNKCKCKDGYRMLANGFTCVPICNNCTDLEYCVEPHICRCIDGYARLPVERLDTENTIECKPVCNRDCVNSDCVEPNVCKCHEGYGDFDDDVFTCEPICTHGCKNGRCTGPETCTCHEGHRLKENSNHICKPICTEECVNAKCIAPEICSCDNGYVPSKGEWKHICVPYCNSSCTNGKCTEPDFCTCNHGYKAVNANASCEPICTKTCFMGNCTAPDTCTCYEGYRLAQGSNFMCEPVCNNECVNGRCTAPDECTCNDGYEKKNSTDDDSKCIVACECENGYCNESSSMCDTCVDGYELAFANNATACKPHCEGGCENGECVEPQKCECNEYYIPDNDTRGNFICVHACGAECKHGNCVQDTGVCSCPYGWTGKYCDEPSHCVIVVTANLKIFSELNGSNFYVETENLMNLEDTWSGPICKDKCLNDINNTTKCIEQLDEERSNFTCYMNIGSRCNVYDVVQAKTYKATVNITVLVSSIMTILFLMATTTAVILYIKRKKREKTIVAEMMKTIKRPDEDCLIENENSGVSL